METKKIEQMPWQPQSTMRGNLAIGGVRESLLGWLRGERGVHAETVLAAVGALAGVAATNAALDQAAKGGAPVGMPQFALALTTNGEQYLFGDAINRHLYPEPGSHLPLWSLLAGAAVQAGAKPEELAQCSEMARHVTSTVGKEGFGRLRSPTGHEPHLGPIELAKRSWPGVKTVFRAPLPTRDQSEPALSEQHWPLIISVVAGQLLSMIKGVLSPIIAFQLAMESAVICSKLHPDVVQPGIWRIQAAAGRVTIERLKT